MRAQYSSDCCKESDFLKQSIGTADSAVVAATTFANGKLSASRSVIYVLSCLFCRNSQDSGVDMQ
jgi:hypothetical protein